MPDPTEKNQDFFKKKLSEPIHGIIMVIKPEDLTNKQGTYMPRLVTFIDELVSYVSCLEINKNNVNQHVPSFALIINQVEQKQAKMVKENLIKLMNIIINDKKNF